MKEMSPFQQIINHIDTLPVGGQFTLGDLGLRSISAGDHRGVLKKLPCIGTAIPSQNGQQTVYERLFDPHIDPGNCAACKHDGSSPAVPCKIKMDADGIGTIFIDPE